MTEITTRRAAAAREVRLAPSEPGIGAPVVPRRRSQVAEAAARPTVVPVIAANLVLVQAVAEKRTASILEEGIMLRPSAMAVRCGAPAAVKDVAQKDVRGRQVTEARRSGARANA